MPLDTKTFASSALFLGEEVNLSLSAQFQCISLIPNYHKWPWNLKGKSVHLRFVQKFSTSCRYYPGSPRNRILQAMMYRENDVTITTAILENLSGSKKLIPYPEKASAVPSKRKHVNPPK